MLGKLCLLQKTGAMRLDTSGAKKPLTPQPSSNKHAPRGNAVKGASKSAGRQPSRPKIVRIVKEEGAPAQGKPSALERTPAQDKSAAQERGRQRQPRSTGYTSFFCSMSQAGVICIAKDDHHLLM